MLSRISKTSTAVLNVSYGRSPLPTKFENDADEIMQDFSDDDIDAMEELANQPISMLLEKC
ncbi:hypothetical protein H5410_028927 [Solanum commersonii]|uniref:Uncharacterized protein n=1 Tax=Solanum commersonii TaxID=4109 RepID=A0A9J5Z3A2_SOLCO|nr:hypothetical protein H5410_028927 [Solanum commersonii]